MLNKPTKIRSRKIRDSARGESCTLRIPGVCNGNPETVVFCHAPSRFKGTGTKSDDFWGAYGCSSCHMIVDGSEKYRHRYDIWMPAIYETQKILFRKGLLKVK